MKKGLCFLAMVVMCLGLLFHSVAQAKDLLVQLKLGQTFIFEVTDGVGNTWDEIIAVNGITIIPSMRQKFFMIDIVGGEEPNEDPGMTNIRSTRNKVYQYHGFGEEHLVWQFAPVGTTWTYEDYDGDIKERTIEAVETVTVPAGTFEECLKIHNRCINCDDETPEWIEWVKPGFFMVKWIDYWTDNPPKIHELKSWTQ